MDLTSLVQREDSQGPRDEQISLAVQLACADAAWNSLLDSEGVAWHIVGESHADSHASRVAVIPSSANSACQTQAIAVTQSGGCVVIEGDLKIEGVDRQGAFALPYEKNDLAGLLETNDPRAVQIEYGRLGNGNYFRIPISVSRQWCSSEVHPKSLALGANGQHVVHHDLVRPVKKNVRQVVVEVLQRAFFGLQVPFVRKWYWPHENRSVFCFRGDLDGGPQETLGDFVDAARPFLHAVSLFVSGEVYDRRMDEMRALHDQGIEIGNHNYAHIVFPDAISNHKNVQRMHRLLGSIGVEGVGHVCPASFWNDSQYSAMEASGYRYFSSFGLDHDNLPHYPAIRGDVGKLLHIPYPCVGDFFTKYEISIGSQEAISIFRNLMGTRYQAGAAISMYGHPDVPGRVGDTKNLVRAIFEEASGKSDVWMCQLADLAEWWKTRHEVQWNPLYCLRSQRLEVQSGIDGMISKTPTGDSPCRVSVHLPDGKWGLIDPSKAASPGVAISDLTALPPLRGPNAADIGEILAIAQRSKSLRDRLRARRRTMKRLCRKYALLYRTQRLAS